MGWGGRVRPGDESVELGGRIILANLEKQCFVLSIATCSGEVLEVELYMDQPWTHIHVYVQCVCTHIYKQ